MPRGSTIRKHSSSIKRHSPTRGVRIEDTRSKMGSIEAELGQMKYALRMLLAEAEKAGKALGESASPGLAKAITRAQGMVARKSLAKKPDTAAA